MIWSGTEGNLSMRPLTETELMSPSDAKIKKYFASFFWFGFVKWTFMYGSWEKLQLVYECTVHVIIRMKTKRAIHCQTQILSGALATVWDGCISDGFILT